MLIAGGSLLGPAIGCGPAHSGPPSPLRYLRVGVDPAEEATVTIASLERAGWALDRQTDQDGVIALAFRREARGTVRVITKRGIMLALPVDHDATPWTFENERRDIDGNGFDDLIVVRRVGDRSCHDVVLVLPDGMVQPMPAESRQWGDSICIESLRDPNGDGRLDAVVSLELRRFARWGDVPSIEAILVAQDGVWRPPDPSTLGVFVEMVGFGRRSRLDDLRAINDGAAAYRTAVELAALALLRGATVGEQLQAFDESVAGVVLSEEQIAAIRWARNVFEGGAPLLDHIQAPPPP